MTTRKQKSTTIPQETSEKIEITPQASNRQKALVFISHDSRDADIAEAFANLLSDVSAGTLKSFRSSDKKGNTGIEFGAEWYTSIMSQLGEATDVVALLTARSIDRPWILYEAGVARGRLETTVLGLALGVPLDKVSTGPFGQFQNCGDDEDSLTLLVMQLLSRNPDASPREEAVRLQVGIFIEKLKTILLAKPQKPSKEINTEEHNTAKLFEEVKAMVRELPRQVDERVRSAAIRPISRSLRRVDPQMFEELLFRFAHEVPPDGRGIALLCILSLVKEDIPWLYEIGVQACHALQSDNKNSIATVQKQMHIGMDFTMMMGSYGIDGRVEKLAFTLARQVLEVLDRALYETPARPARIKRTPPKTS